MLMTLPLFLNTVVLGGSTSEKLRAAAAAGFADVELWRKDVDAALGGRDAVQTLLHETRLGLADYQVLLDFDGASATTRETKREEALSLLDDAFALGAKTLIVPANTRDDCVAEKVVPDLQWLVHEAEQRGIRIAYEPMAWSALHATVPSAWAIIEEVGAPNIGIVIDAFHIFVLDRTVQDLEGIPADRIYLVQLSDLDVGLTPDTLIDTARHRRLLPGQGRFPLRTLLTRLEDMDYRGPLGIEVFNDALLAAPAEETARAAMAALKEVLAL